MIRHVLTVLVLIVLALLVAWKLLFLRDVYAATQKIDAEQRRADSVESNLLLRETVSVDSFGSLPSVLVPSARKQRTKP